MNGPGPQSFMGEEVASAAAPAESAGALPTTEAIGFPIDIPIENKMATKVPTSNFTIRKAMTDTDSS